LVYFIAICCTESILLIWEAIELNVNILKSSWVNSLDPFTVFVATQFVLTILFYHN
jgi:hypothetical protein